MATCFHPTLPCLHPAPCLHTWTPPATTLLPSTAVAAADLEDREGTDSWTVGSRPPPGQALPPNASRVGAFAAAAGRSASAFVEAFRSVVGNHRRCARTVWGNGRILLGCSSAVACAALVPGRSHTPSHPPLLQPQHLQHAPWRQRTLIGAAAAQRRNSSCSIGPLSCWHRIVTGAQGQAGPRRRTRAGAFSQPRAILYGSQRRTTHCRCRHFGSGAVADQHMQRKRASVHDSSR